MTVLEQENLIWKRWKGYIPDWNNPQDVNEKICWEIINNRMSGWTELTDKVLVRDFIKDKGYGNNLSTLYGVWNNVDDIDFDSLPDTFVIKCNHDSGSSTIVDKNKGFNEWQIKENLRRHLARPYGTGTCEPHYYGIERKILAEEVLNDVHDFSKTPVDYKFWCFDGKVASCMVCYDRVCGGHAVFDLYDPKTWEPMRDKLTNKLYGRELVPKPEELEYMVKMASDLSKGFPHVRVDLYNTKRGVVFGEMTFTSMCGRIYYFTQDYLKELGDLMILQQ